MWQSGLVTSVHRSFISIWEVSSYLGVVRASIGRFTTKEEIDVLVDAVREIAEG